MQEVKQYLVVMGVPSIKKYVFGTDRLMEIRGASSLLDHLNREEMGNFLKKKKNKGELAEAESVYAGGGAGQFIIKAEKTKLEECLKELEKYFTEQTAGGIRLIYGIADYSENEYPKALRQAVYRSETNREEFPIISSTPIHTGFFRECDSCSEMASEIREYKDDKQVLCKICDIKEEYSRGGKKAIWDELAGFLKKSGITVARPETFEEIGEQCTARKDYTAVVYADGNSMGKLIKQIQDKDQYRYFSETMEDCLRDACFEAIYDTYFKKTKKTPEIMPADILLLGGDDLVVYLTAEGAFPFAIRVARMFNEKTKERFADSDFDKYLKGRGLTISLGIAYGKTHTPFSIMLNQAEELLKSAKKGGTGDPRSCDYFSPAYIDYHISTNFNQLNVRDSRVNHLQLQRMKIKQISESDDEMIRKRIPIRLYQKPYSLEDAEDLLTHARSLKNLIPSTQLNRLGNAPTSGKINGTLECLKIYTRTPKGDKRLAIWNALSRFDCIINMPWNENNEDEDTTMVVDLAELAGFCRSDNMGEADAS